MNLHLNMHLDILKKMERNVKEYSCIHTQIYIIYINTCIYIYIYICHKKAKYDL